MKPIKYFTLKELLKTQTGYHNRPTSFTIVNNLASLASILDILRIEYGKPIYVTSGYRSYDVNVAVGGTPHSLHMQGRAADLRPMYTLDKEEEEKNLQQLKDVVIKHRDLFSEVKFYDTYIHVAQ